MQDITIRLLSDTDDTATESEVALRRRPGARARQNLEMNILKSENEALKRKVRAKEHQLQSAHSQIDLLAEHNAVLKVRSAELTRGKIAAKVSGCVLLIADSSLFTDMLFDSDPVLQEVDVSMFNEADLKLQVSSMHKGNFSRSYIARSPDGEPCILMRFRMSEGSQADIKNLKFVRHEHRILTYIGLHPNILRTFGIIKLNKAFQSVLSYDGLTSKIEQGVFFFRNRRQDPF